MVRTVKVRLELDRDDYKRGLRDAAGETRGFDGEVRTLGKDVHATGIEVKAAGTQVEAMGREVDTASKKTTTLGNETEKTKAKIVDLAREFHKTKAALAEMGEEFRKTGKLDVDQFKSLSSKLRDLESVGKAAGIETGKGFSAGLQGALKTPVVGPAIATAIAAAITLGAPVIGAAVTAAVGGGVIAGGILLAAKDPRVGAAWSKLGTSAMTSLTQAAAPFVDPLVRGAERFGSTLHDILPSISADFAAMAPIVDRLVDGVSGLVVNMMPGIDALVREAGPTLTMLAGELPRVGAAFSSMFESIAAGGEGGKQALHDLLVLTEGMIVSTGKTIEGFEKLYQADRAFYGALAATFTNNQTAWENAGKQMLALKYGTKAIIPVAGMAADAFGKVAASMVPVGREASITGAQFTTLSGQINATLQTSDVLAGQMAGKLFNSMMSLDQAALSFARSQTQVTESIKDNGRSLDIHTAKGQENIGAILGAVQANMAQYQANIAVGMSATDAAKAYDGNTQALERQLRQAGFTQEAIDGLIGKYRNVPSKVNTDIAMKGLTEAIQSLDEAIRLANNLDGRKVTTFIETRETRVYSTIDANGARHASKVGVFAEGGIRTAAVGLIIPPSDPGTVLTGEPQTGGEVLIPMRGIDTTRAAMLAQAAVGGYGLDVVPRQAPGYAAFASTRPMGAGGGAGSAGVGGNSFNIEHFHADTGQSPHRIAEDLWFLTEARGGA